MMNSPMTVGLFGTCGKSRWRDAFIAAYEAAGIPFFNPQIPNWTPEFADVEAWHLANDQLVLFPVTDETYAAGSLAESGFSILQALRMNSSRFVVLYIAADVEPALYIENPTAAADSRRARALVRTHLAKLSSPNLFIVDGLERMLDVSLKLYAALDLIAAARGNNEDWRSVLPPAFWHQLVLSKTVEGLNGAEPATAPVQATS